MAAAIKIPSFSLNTGQVIPAVGVGCWMGRVGEGDHVRKMVKDALELGYRHIDTAENYGNEESVGQAIQESGIPRRELFITTKLAGPDHSNVAAAVDRSLQKLQLTYIDLYLMHWPQAFDSTGRTLQPQESPTFSETWTEMEKLLAYGKVRAIGVSNFSTKNLSKLLETAKIIPAVNQVETHPCLPQHELLSLCHERGILLTAYSPVAKNKLAENPVVSELARKKGSTTAQILLSWGVQRGTAVIPKSEKRERLKENFMLVKLEPDEMRQLDQLHQNPGMHRSVCGFHSAELGGSCFGWTYEQLGWNMVVPGLMRS